MTSTFSLDREDQHAYRIMMRKRLDKRPPEKLRIWGYDNNILYLIFYVLNKGGNGSDTVCFEMYV